MFDGIVKAWDLQGWVGQVFPVSWVGRGWEGGGGGGVEVGWEQVFPHPSGDVWSSNLINRLID